MKTFYVESSVTYRDLDDWLEAEFYSFTTLSTDKCIKEDACTKTAELFYAEFDDVKDVEITIDTYYEKLI